MTVLLILAIGLVLSLAGLWAVGFFKPRSVQGPARWPPPLPDTTPRRPGELMTLGGFSVLALVGWMLVSAVALGVASRAFPGSTAARIYAIVVGYLGGIAVLAVPPLATIARQASPLKSPGKDIVAGLIGLLLCLPWVYGVQLLTVEVMKALHIPVEAEHELLKMLHEHGTPAVVGAVVLSAVVAAPVFEELMFRRTVQTLLVRAVVGRGRAMGEVTARWVGIAGASLCFALLHPAWSIPAIFTLSLALGYVYERRGSVLAPLALHAGFNAVSVAAAVLSLT